MLKKVKSTTYNIEKGFISKLLETKNMKLVRDQQIKTSFFTGENKNVFQFIVETYTNTGEVLTPRALNKRFPSYQLEMYSVGKDVEAYGTEESLQHWCIELRKKAKHNKLVEMIEEAVGELDDHNTEIAYSVIKKGVWAIEGEIVETTSVDVTRDTNLRVEKYKERKLNKGMLGISTGIAPLDHKLKGLAKATLTTIIANTGVGKAVTLDTPILTPSGFTPMRNINIGSSVFDEDGKECKVTAVYPQGLKKVYRVTFSDNTYVDCCKEHLWKFKTVDDVTRNNEWRVETLNDLMKRPIKRGRLHNLCIPVSKAINLPEQNLEIDPYVFGCLLGDGGFTTDRITFTNPEKDILDTLNNSLAHLGKFTKHKGTNCQYSFLSNTSKNHLYRSIKSMNLQGKSSKQKFIPEPYLLGSIEQRLQLVRGLVDTDGSVDEKGHTLFFTKSERLKEDFKYLVRSLGYRCYDRCYTRDTELEYVVYVSTDSNILFTSSKHTQKHKKRTNPNKTHHYDHLKIIKIEELPQEEEMQCITVDSDKHTFICGDFIVTHNTWFLTLLACYAQLSNYKVCFFLTEMSTEIMQDRIEAMLFGMVCGELDYNSFKSGALSPEKEQEYFEFLEDVLPTLEPLVLETATGVSSVASVVDREKPDIIFIDGAYLMEDEQGAKDDWLRVTHITRDLKKMSKNWNIPVVINTQADKNTSKKTGPELGSIMYTQSIGQDSDNVLSLYQNELMFNDREMGIRVLKQREGVLGAVTINWDFQKMNFKSIYSEDNKGGVDTIGDYSEEDENNFIVVE